jgi:hypothetical protein
MPAHSRALEPTVWSRVCMSVIRQLLGGRTPLRFAQADATFSQSASTPATFAVTDEQPASTGYNVKIASQEVIGMVYPRGPPSPGSPSRMLSAGLILGSRP